LEADDDKKAGESDIGHRTRVAENSLPPAGRIHVKCEDLQKYNRRTVLAIDEYLVLKSN
jgi:hypothetical protein